MKIQSKHRCRKISAIDIYLIKLCMELINIEKMNDKLLGI